MSPHTRNLKASVPRVNPDKAWNEKVNLALLDSDEYLLTGCKFAGRCPHVQNICRTHVPDNYEVGGRMVKCFLYDEAIVGADSVAKYLAGELPQPEVAAAAV